MNLADIINKAADNVGGNAALAEELGTGTNTLANWRNRPGTGPNEENQIALARLSGVPLSVVAAAVQAKTAKNKVMRGMWADLLGKLEATAGLALGALLMAGLLVAPNDAHAAIDITNVRANSIHIVALSHSSTC